MHIYNSNNKSQSFIPNQNNSDRNSQSIQFRDNRSTITTQLKIQKMANPVIQRKENKTGMPDNLKSGIENLSGLDMSDVKVHYNSSQTAQMQAHAFAQGNQIHIASGQERHLPHEAWHVVQQKQGRVSPTKQLKGKVSINDDSGLEKEADVMGAKALQMHQNGKVGIVEQSPSPDNSSFRNIQLKEDSIIQRVKAGNYDTNTDCEIYGEKAGENNKVEYHVIANCKKGLSVTVKAGAKEKKFAPVFFSKSKDRTWCHAGIHQGWIRDEALTVVSTTQSSVQSTAAPQTVAPEGIRSYTKADAEHHSNTTHMDAKTWNESTVRPSSPLIITVPNSKDSISMFKTPGHATPIDTPVAATGLLRCMAIRVAIRYKNKIIAAFIAHSESGSATGEDMSSNILSQFDGFLRAVNLDINKGDLSSYSATIDRAASANPEFREGDHSAVVGKLMGKLKGLNIDCSMTSLVRGDKDIYMMNPLK